MVGLGPGPIGEDNCSNCCWSSAGVSGWDGVEMVGLGDEDDNEDDGWDWAGTLKWDSGGENCSGVLIAVWVALVVRRAVLPEMGGGGIWTGVPMVETVLVYAVP